MADEQPPIQNFIITTSTAIGRTSVFLVRSTREGAMERVRQAQHAWPSRRVEVYLLAGEKSLILKDAIHLQQVEHLYPKDYIQAAAFLIDEHWNGKEGGEMNRDIMLIVDMLKDTLARKTSRPVQDLVEQRPNE